MSPCGADGPGRLLSLSLCWCSSYADGHRRCDTNVLRKDHHGHDAEPLWANEILQTFLDRGRPYPALCTRTTLSVAPRFFGCAPRTQRRRPRHEPLAISALIDKLDLSLTVQFNRPQDRPHRGGPPLLSSLSSSHHVAVAIGTVRSTDQPEP
jgi:hypothetical protein